MADSSSSFTWDNGSSFSTPFLFQNYDRDYWPTNTRQWRARRRSLASASYFLNDDYFDTDDQSDDDDDTLAMYLPYDATLLPPLTRKIITQVTLQYVSNEGESDILSKVLNAIDKEYKMAKNVPPVTVGGQMFDDEIITKILSFAALNRLPKQATLLLFGCPANIKDPASALQECRHAFEQGGGWNSVSFPTGLGLALQRKFVDSSNDEYSPSSWRLTRRKKRAALYAATAVEQASKVEPPPRRPSREDLLAAMQQAEKLANIETQPEAKLLFFPQRRQLWKRTRRAVIRWVKASLRILFKVVVGVVRALISKLRNLFASGFVG